MSLWSILILILNLFLCVVLQGGLISFLCTLFVQFSQHHLLNKLSLAHSMCLHFFWILIDYNVWIYFWALYFVPLMDMSVFMAVSCWFDYNGLNFILGSMIPPTLFFYLRIAAAMWSLLWFHIKFWNVCSRSVKYVIGILIGIALNL